MLLEVKNVFKQVTEPSGEVITISRAGQLTLDKGRQMLLTGPSGSGKTTLLHMIAGLLAPSCGEIYFEGVRIDNMPERQRDLWRARHIGYVFQKLNLIEAMTAEENILLAGYFAGADIMELKKRAAELLERVGLLGKKNVFPGKLSIGEQQRIAVVRAVINKPVLLLADEPTASLDSENSRIVLGLLRSLCTENGTALILSTHDESVKAQFDEWFDIKSGRFVTHGHN